MAESGAAAARRFWHQLQLRQQQPSLTGSAARQQAPGRAQSAGRTRDGKASCGRLFSLCAQDELGEASLAALTAVRRWPSDEAPGTALCAATDGSSFAQGEQADQARGSDAQVDGASTGGGCWQSEGAGADDGLADGASNEYEMITGQIKLSAHGSFEKCACMQEGGVLRGMCGQPLENEYVMNQGFIKQGADVRDYKRSSGTVLQDGSSRVEGSGSSSGGHQVGRQREGRGRQLGGGWRLHRRLQSQVQRRRRRVREGR